MLRKFYARVLILGTIVSTALILTTVLFVRHHRNRMLEDAKLNRITGMSIHYPELSVRGFKEDPSSVGANWDWEYYRAVRAVLQGGSIVDFDADDIPEIARESLNPNVVERGKVGVLSIDTLPP